MPEHGADDPDFQTKKIPCSHASRGCTDRSPGPRCSADGLLGRRVHLGAVGLFDLLDFFHLLRWCGWSGSRCRGRWFGGHGRRSSGCRGGGRCRHGRGGRGFGRRRLGQRGNSHRGKYCGSDQGFNMGHGSLTHQTTVASAPTVLSEPENPRACTFNARGGRSLTPFTFVYMTAKIMLH